MIGYNTQIAARLRAEQLYAGKSRQAIQQLFLNQPIESRDGPNGVLDMFLPGGSTMRFKFDSLGRFITVTAVDRSTGYEYPTNEFDARKQAAADGRYWYGTRRLTMTQILREFDSDHLGRSRTEILDLLDGQSIKASGKSQYTWSTRDLVTGEVFTVVLGFRGDALARFHVSS